ncbi:MAG: UDP-glucose 4-epimerase GalE, partial [Streptococcaceae bacterium]|nr:UDP-glucose 4-epimerase GalE [Streptococcaceae bacterium]
KFYETDILDKPGVVKVFSENKIDAVIHFAGLKAVGESVQKPLFYYHNNMTGTFLLLEVMLEFNVKKIVFSSSATVYGMPETVPLTEESKTFALSPYGQTKFMLEQVFRDVAVSDDTWSISLLRYFNPVGAHESGTIGEDPKGIPNNLMPFITQVASGKLEQLQIFGNDYNTPDGTAVRDYIHVLDLAEGHLKALQFLEGKQGVYTHNLGTGIGYSVLDMVKAFENANDLTINYKFAPRRQGDAETVYADPQKARVELGWVAKYNLEDMCQSSWNWQKNNPRGFEE